VGILSGLIFGIVLVPLVLASIVATPLVGFRLEGLNPINWLALGWRYALAAGGQTIGSTLSALNFSLAQSQMELPILALLSVLGLLDHAPQTRSFTRMIAAMVLVPFAIELVPNAPSYFPLRGLYLIPLYMLAALGAESVVRRVNGRDSPWKIPAGLAFAAAFAAYLFVSQLGYTLMMFGLPLLPLP
jgi:branched-subunit amino acid transport protein